MCKREKTYIIVGLAFVIIGLTVLLVDLLTYKNIFMDGIFNASIFISIGFMPISISLLRYSKQIIDKRHELSVFLKIMGIFWLVTGTSNLVIVVILKTLSI